MRLVLMLWAVVALCYYCGDEKRKIREIYS